MSYSDEEFESEQHDSDNEGISDVKISSKAEKRSPSSHLHAQHDDNDSGSDESVDVDLGSIDLHGGRSRIKLNKAPPETLLRKYKSAIAESLEDKKVS